MVELPSLHHSWSTYGNPPISRYKLGEMQKRRQNRRNLKNIDFAPRSVLRLQAIYSTLVTVMSPTEPSRLNASAHDCWAPAFCLLFFFDTIIGSQWPWLWCFNMPFKDPQCKQYRSRSYWHWNLYTRPWRDLKSQCNVWQATLRILSLDFIFTLANNMKFPSYCV